MKNHSPMYELYAPAKLTLSLAITGVRESGLHELEAEMVTIDFQDTLRLREGDTEVTYQGEYPIAPSSNDDLIVRAHNAVGLSMKVEVDKKNPPGGGLGGIPGPLSPKLINKEGLPRKSPSLDRISIRRSPW